MSELYTVPAKTNVHAKDLISAFEKGQVQSLNVDEDKVVKVHPELIDEELGESGIAKKLRQAFQSEEGRQVPKLHPELSVEECAEPGTAKKLLLTFEAKRQVSQNSSPIKTPSSAGIRLSKERFEEESKPVVNGFVNGDANASLSIERKECNGSVEDEIKLTKVEVIDTANVRSSMDGGITITTTTLSVDQNDPTVNQEQKVKEENAEQVPRNDVILTSKTELIMTSPEAVTSAETIQHGTIVTLVADDKKDNKVEDVAAQAVNRSGEGATVSVEIQPAAVSTSESRRNVLIVRAVKEETSLDVDLLDSTVRTLTEAGHDVSVTNVFKLSPEQSEAEEYKKLQHSDLIVILYRTVLNTFPAALKAWFENVLIQNDGHNVDKIALKGKRAVLVVTTDIDKSDNEIDVASSLQTGVLRLVSLDVLPPLIIFGAGQNFDEGEKSAVLSQWTNRLTSIWEEKAL